MAELKKECDTCHGNLKLVNFYKTNDTDTYLDGYYPTCKKCLTMTVDNKNPSTFLWILQKLDVPYVPQQWDNLLAKYNVPGKVMTGSTILGRYLSKMRLGKWGKLRFNDTEKYIRDDVERQKEFFKLLNAKRAEDPFFDEREQLRQETLKAEFTKQQSQERIQEQIEASQIDPWQSNIKWDDIIADRENNAETSLPQMTTSITETNVDNKPAGLGQESTINYDSELTLEEKRYLIFKWGKSYSLEDLVRMETLYQETADSFDVSNPNHKDYLKKICKASLQLDRALDYGDSDSAAKYSRMYDMLNKSAKFTAASNKVDKEEYIGSVGELVAICEKEGFIPRYHINENKDIVDKTLADMNTYVKKLISNEMNLQDLIEASIQMIAAEEVKAKEEENNILEEEDDDNFDEDYEYVVNYDLQNSKNK